MTYREKLNSLRNDVNAAQIRVGKADNALFEEGDGLVDASKFEELRAAQERWLSVQRVLLDLIISMQSNDHRYEDEII